MFKLLFFIFIICFVVVVGFLLFVVVDVVDIGGIILTLVAVIVVVVAVDLIRWFKNENESVKLTFFVISYKLVILQLIFFLFYNLIKNFI